MHLDTEAFLNGLFGQCTLFEQPMFLTLSAIHPTLALPRPSRHIPLGNIRALKVAVDALTRANEAGWGAYIGIAPRRPGLTRWQRGTKADLVALPALFIDIDAPTSDTIHNLQNFVLPPSCIVHSGHGLHAYFYLDSPSQVFSACEQAMRGLTHLFGGDPVSSVAHSMRLPQTRNTKLAVNSLCRLVYHDSTRRYPLREFFKYLPETNATPRMPPLPRLPNTGAIPGKEQLDVAKRHLLDAVIQRLGGVKKSNGFWAALCPYGHSHDRRGSHFNYTESGTGICFGRHGRIEFAEMCSLLGVTL